MDTFETHHAYDPLKRVLESVHELFYVKNEIRGNTVVVPEWDMTIVPRIEQCGDRIAVVGFHISDPDFDEPLYECCASTGKDTDSAIGSCVGSFLFAFMNGILQMKNRDGGKQLQSTFGGKTHTWRSYNSDLVGMGESVDSGENAVATKYWDMLKNEIVKRLGNQKMCYVKIFASKAIGKSDEQVTGEVRINDVPSAELSKIVSKHAAEWNINQFASQKQFFFVKQENAPTDEYSGESGRAVLRGKVKTALELFVEVKDEKSFEALPDKLAAALGDPVLATECFSFIPEMCAEHAFQEVQFSEQIIISVQGENETISCYRTQLAHYYPIQNAVFGLFSDGTFGEATNDLYRSLIGMSATGSAVSQFLEKSDKLSDCSISSLCYNVPRGFELK